MVDVKKIFFVLIFFVLLPCKSVFSAEAAYDENVYQEQYDSSGAKELFDELILQFYVFSRHHVRTGLPEAFPDDSSARP